MSHVRRAALHLVCTALVLGIASTAVVRRIAHPQVLNFSIAGSVADVSGTAVPSAQVKVTKHKTNEGPAKSRPTTPGAMSSPR